MISLTEIVSLDGRGKRCRRRGRAAYSVTSWTSLAQLARLPCYRTQGVGRNWQRAQRLGARQGMLPITASDFGNTARMMRCLLACRNSIMRYAEPTDGGRTKLSRERQTWPVIRAPDDGRRQFTYTTLSNGPKMGKEESHQDKIPPDIPSERRRKEA